MLKGAALSGNAFCARLKAHWIRFCAMLEDQPAVGNMALNIIEN